MSKEVPQDGKTPRRIQLNDAESFSTEGFDGHVYTEVPGANFNALRVDVHGSHPRKKMLGDTTRNYLVIEGIGKFTLGGETFDVQPGDLFSIPPEGEYHYEGQMTLFEFNVSPSGNIQDQKL